MNSSFLDSARQGKSNRSRYFVGILLSLGCWIGGTLLVKTAAWKLFEWMSLLPQTTTVSGITKLEETLKTSPQWFFIINTAPFLFLSIGTGIATKLLHKRAVRSLISPTLAISRQRFLVGFAVWFSLAALQTIVEFMLNPQGFSWNFEPIQWFTFLPVALLLTPIQTSAEELFFRGYLLQGWGLIVRQPILLTLVASLPFALVHFGNPEMDRGAIWIALTYVGLAIFLTAITLRDNGLELALGVHAANNLFIVLFVNAQDSALRSPALILQTIPTEPPITFLSLLLSAIAFCWIVFGNKAFGKLTQPRS
jgi:uncharacterized protein